MCPAPMLVALYQALELSIDVAIAFRIDTKEGICRKLMCIGFFYGQFIWLTERPAPPIVELCCPAPTLAPENDVSEDNRLAHPH